MKPRSWLSSLFVATALLHVLPTAASASSPDFPLSDGQALSLSGLIVCAGAAVLVWHYLNPPRARGSPGSARGTAAHPSPPIVRLAHVPRKDEPRSRALAERLARAARVRMESAVAVERAFEASPGLSPEAAARRTGVSLELARFHLARLHRTGLTPG